MSNSLSSNGENSLNVMAPVFQYDFGCNSHSQAVISRNAPFVGPLVSNSADGSPPLRCHYRSGGVMYDDEQEETASPSSSLFLQSSNTIGTLRANQMSSNATAMVVELWLTPPPTEAAYDGEEDLSVFPPKPILTIGGATPLPSDGSVVGCRNTDLYMAQRGPYLEIRYRDNDYFQSCRTLIVRQQALVPEEINHMVLTIQETGTFVYLDGDMIIPGAYNEYATNLTTWDPNHYVQVFSNPQYPEWHFEGSLHQVSMYQEPVDEHDVQVLYSQGPNARVVSPEDGGDGSNPAEARSPLYLEAARYEQTIHVLQDEQQTFRLGGYNASTADWEVMVEVLTVPIHGSLFSIQGGEILPGVNSLEPLYHDPQDFGGSAPTTAVLSYRPWKASYFNVPTMNFHGDSLHVEPESFSYRMIALDRLDGALIGWSETKTQALQVVHVNHAPSLRLEQDMATIFRDDEDAGRPILTLGSMVVEDIDLDIDIVRVNVWATSGSLTITSEEALLLADFDCSFQNWQCFGTGIANRNMTFVATPTDAAQILSHLEYEAFHWDQEDQVTIQLFDGSGGACLSETDHRQEHVWGADYMSFHPQCYSITANVPVPAVSRKEWNQYGPRGGASAWGEYFRTFGWPDAAFWCLFGLPAIWVLRKLVVLTWSYYLARGAKLHPESENDEEVIEMEPVAQPIGVFIESQGLQTV